MTSHQEVRAPFLFQKTQNHAQNWCCNENKNEAVCFSGKFKTVTIQLSLGENISFAISPQFQDSQKHVSCSFRANEISIVLIKLYTWEGDKSTSKWSMGKRVNYIVCLQVQGIVESWHSFVFVKNMLILYLTVAFLKTWNYITFNISHF